MRLAFASINFANFRTHRKIAVIDGVTSFLGGINIHDPELPSRAGKAAWRDLQARIEGEPVHRLQRLFLESWNYCHGELKLSAKTMDRYFPATRCGAGIPAQIVASGPDDNNAPMHAFFLAAIGAARSRVLIETPYLVPDEPLKTPIRIANSRRRRRRKPSRRSTQSSSSAVSFAFASAAAVARSIAALQLRLMYSTRCAKSEPSVLRGEPLERSTIPTCTG